MTEEEQRERVRESSKKFYQKHREQRLESQKTYREKHEPNLLALKRLKTIDKLIKLRIHKKIKDSGELVFYKIEENMGLKRGMLCQKLHTCKCNLSVAEYFYLCETTGIDPMKLYNKMKNAVDEKIKARRNESNDDA